MTGKKGGKGSKVFTTAFGIPVAEDQNSLTAGPRFYAQKMVRRSSNDPSSLHCQQNQSISPLKLIRQMGTEALYS